MNNNKYVLDFLTDLSNNNSKEWMDEHRERYHQAKAYWLEQVAEILEMLKPYHPAFFTLFQPKDCISRINNNRMFHPDRPIYKDYFTFSVMDEKDDFSPMHISVGVKDSLIGWGYHRPSREILDNIRGAIDYEGHKLKGILEEDRFQHVFGGLSNFGDKLKTSPRGYAKDHPHVEYLRYKSFTAMRPLSRAEIIGDDFLGIVEEAYVISKDFSAFLRKGSMV